MAEFSLNGIHIYKLHLIYWKPVLSDTRVYVIVYIFTFLKLWYSYERFKDFYDLTNVFHLYKYEQNKTFRVFNSYTLHLPHKQTHTLKKIIYSF